MVRIMTWVIFAAAIAMTSPATAQENACEADHKEFCSKSEGLHALKCLVDNFDKLSAGCKTQIEPARLRIEAAKKTPAAAAAPDAVKPAKP